MTEQEKLKNRIKKCHLECIGLAVILALAAVLLWVKATSSNQAPTAMLPGIRLEGEYKIGDGEWKKIREGEHISATKGDVTLRGRLMILFPGDEEAIEPVTNGTSVAVYCNHINVQYKVPGMEIYTSDIEPPDFGEYACGAVWNVYDYEGTDTDTMEIVIHNPHKFGNENAVDELLESLSVYGNKEGNLFQNKASGFLLPALCVQTIVENAVCHGIARTLDGGTVRIVSDEDENAFLVSVIDDGRGFDTDILSGEMKDHIGISNTRDRLSKMCGGWMEINSQPGEGTRVDIHIPKNERKC